MIYRGTQLSRCRMIGSSSNPPTFPVSKLSLCLSLLLFRLSSLLPGEGDGGGDKSFEGEKAESSITINVPLFKKLRDIIFFFAGQ
jgi:hypothetical protein